MLRIRTLSRSLGHIPTARAPAPLVRPLINTSLHRALFPLLNHMQPLLSPLLIRMPPLRTLCHRLSHMPHLCSRIRLNPPHSLFQRPLLQCPHVARLMHLNLHPLSPCRPSPDNSPRATLILSLPPPSPLSASRIYQIPICLDATRLPSLCHQALLARDPPAPMQTRSRCRRIPPPPSRRQG
jgi:hypothetical protein